MDEITQTINVAKGISDYGFGTVAAGAFVVLALVVLGIVFWWFKTERAIREDRPLVLFLQ